MSKPPQTLDELGDSLALWEKLNGDQEQIEAKFAPLEEQFSIMDKYEVQIPEEVSAMLHDLPNEWGLFQQTLVDADVMLKKHKASQASYLVDSSLFNLNEVYWSKREVY